MAFKCEQKLYQGNRKERREQKREILKKLYLQGNSWMKIRLKKPLTHVSEKEKKSDPVNVIQKQAYSPRRKK